MPGWSRQAPAIPAKTLPLRFTTRWNGTGFRRTRRTGYSIGLSYPPDWGERTMSFGAGDKTVLQPGMIFHFMPALWLDDGGSRSPSRS
jgi:ectoine hydrolase